MDLTKHNKLLVHQAFEGFELLGYETRNKYQILDEEQKQIGFAAEQQKGILGFLMRQFLGHYRSFHIGFFNVDREHLFDAHHPFRIFFQKLEVAEPSGKVIGTVQQRFALLSKKFDVNDSNGKTLMSVSSPIWKIWTFPFLRQDKEVAKIEKKWSGFLSEAFTDKDKFLVSYNSDCLNESERKVILAASIFVDLQYFEKKAN